VGVGLSANSFGPTKGISATRIVTMALMTAMMMFESIFLEDSFFDITTPILLAMVEFCPQIH
jgi:hypothetical protein